MRISMPAGMMKQCHGQRSRCEDCRLTIPGCISLPQAVRLLGTTKKRRDWWCNCLRLIPRCEFPTLSRMYRARFGNQNIWQSMSMLCEWRAYLNDADGLDIPLRFYGSKYASREMDAG